MERPVTSTGSEAWWSRELTADEVRQAHDLEFLTGALDSLADGLSVESAPLDSTSFRYI